MMMPLKLLGLGTVLLAAVSADSASYAQDWPSRPVKVVVPFAAAGTTDRLGRIAAEELSKTFKQQFYVENRVGGGGVVGAVQVARADPDGYTLMIGGYGPTSSHPPRRPILATTRCPTSPISR
jgi:tripartite-type tricarboxylate transporter receptor subunit TctC